jgi:hypothetical protein
VQFRAAETLQTARESNLKLAKILGLAVPQSILARADEIIK